MVCSKSADTKLTVGTESVQLTVTNDGQSQSVCNADQPVPFTVILNAELTGSATKVTQVDPDNMDAICGTGTPENPLTGAGKWTFVCTATGPGTHTAKFKAYTDAAGGCEPSACMHPVSARGGAGN